MNVPPKRKIPVQPVKKVVPPLVAPSASKPPAAKSPPVKPPAIDPSVLMEGFEAYYDDGAKDFWTKNNQGDYIRINEASLKRILKKLGASSHTRKEDYLSEVDNQVTNVQLEHSICYAGPLAGYNKGAHKVEGRTVLVTDSPRLIEPKQGDWRLFKALVRNMLGKDQEVFFYGWLKFGLECLSSGQCHPGQALVLAGERECGKSLLQDLITELFGGRSAKPYQFMTGGTSFNSDLFTGEHLVIEDESASTDIRARRHFGAAIKQMTACSVQRHHGKNRNALSLSPFWRLSVSLNDEPENLMVLPPLDESIKDKLILLKAAKRPMPAPVSSPKEKTEFRQRLSAELPALIFHLRSWEIPRELRSDRYGITHYLHPDLLDGLDELAPESQLMELIESFLVKEDCDEWRGTATQLDEGLHDFSEHQARRLLRSASICGTYLERLSKQFPDRITRKTLHGKREWLIRRVIES